MKMQAALPKTGVSPGGQSTVGDTLNVIEPPRGVIGFDVVARDSPPSSPDQRPRGVLTNRSLNSLWPVARAGGLYARSIAPQPSLPGCRRISSRRGVTAAWTLQLDQNLACL